MIFSLAADSTNSGGSSTGGGGFAETDFSSASCGSSIDAAGLIGPANSSSSPSVMANVGGDHQLVRVFKMLIYYIMLNEDYFMKFQIDGNGKTSLFMFLLTHTAWKL